MNIDQKIIQQIMKTTNMSKSEICHILDVDIVTLNKWESGKARISLLDVILKIEQKFGIKLDRNRTIMIRRDGNDLFYCEVCKQVWSKYKNEVDYFEDFRSYGMPRLTCPKCEDRVN